MGILRPLHTSVTKSRNTEPIPRKQTFQSNKEHITSQDPLWHGKASSKSNLKTLHKLRKLAGPCVTDAMSIFTHHGACNEHSRQSPILKFIEKYFSKVDSLDLISSPSSDFYAPSAVHHDTKGNIHVSGPRIWQCMQRLLSPFDGVHHEMIEARVVPDENGQAVVYAQFLTRFRLKGDQEEIVAPRFFVLTVGKAAGMYEGTDGMQIYDVRLFWDTGILGRHVTERKRKEKLRMQE